MSEEAAARNKGGRPKEIGGDRRFKHLSMGLLYAAYGLKIAQGETNDWISGADAYKVIEGIGPSIANATFFQALISLTERGVAECYEENARRKYYRLTERGDAEVERQMGEVIALRDLAAQKTPNLDHLNFARVTDDRRVKSGKRTLRSQAGFKPLEVVERDGKHFVELPEGWGGEVLSILEEEDRLTIEPRGIEVMASLRRARRDVGDRDDFWDDFLPGDNG